jgi:multidrug transporter EmrE-like cation transporter
MTKSLLLGILFVTLGQIGSYIQLQCSYKFNWLEKYQVVLYLSSIPIMWLYVKSVQYITEAFDGQIWPGRFIGFSCGIIVFALMSSVIFKEPMTAKTNICILLALLIISIQIFWKP